MKRKLQGVMFAALILALPAFALAQAGGRLAGKVLDENGEPIEGVTIDVTCAAIAKLHDTKTTNKKGKFTVSVTDATQIYDLVLSKEGHVTLKQQEQFGFGSTITREYSLPTRQHVAQQAGVDLNAAETTVESAPNEGPMSIRTYNQGVEAQKLGDLDAALVKYQKAAELDPTLAAAFASVAGVLSDKGDFAGAAAAAEQALLIDPSDYRALVLRYEALRDGGDADGAKMALKALTAAGDIGDVSARLFNEGADFYNAGDLESAKQSFEQVLNLDPSSKASHEALAQIYFKQKNYSMALATAQNFLELEESLKMLQIAYESARLSEKDDEMMAVLPLLAAADPVWAGSALYDQATAAYDNGYYNQALMLLEMVLKTQPDHAKANFVGGMAAFNTGDTARAKSWLAKFVELAPDDPDAAIATEMMAYIE